MLVRLAAMLVAAPAGVLADCAPGAVANAIAPSARERALWLPVLLSMLGSSTLVALA